MIYGYGQDLRRPDDLQNPNYPKGRLTKLTAGTTVVEYNRIDAIGRVAAHRQETDGIDYPFSYTYNLTDGVTSIKYPSSRIVQTGYDMAGRASGLTGSKAGENPVTYVEGASSGQGIQYSAHGVMTQWKLGSGFYERWGFNSRLQPQLIQLGSSAGNADAMSLELGYGSANNGNLRTQRITGSGLDRTQSYEYDALNRLEQATEAGYGKGRGLELDSQLCSRHCLLGDQESEASEIRQILHERDVRTRGSIQVLNIGI